MPARRFDRDRVRRVRREDEASQADVASALGLADSTLAGWESGATTPDQEKLPALAEALNRPLDDLFPRDGLPDLIDLRCDAGLYRYETKAIIGTKSDGPVAGAEQGIRRLKDRYVPLLAAAYRVTEDELKRAQDRSFGEADEGDAEAGKVPETLAEKITLLLERSYPGRIAPGDQEIADSVNAYAGSQVTSAEGIEALRTGEGDAPVPVVLEGLAQFFDVSKLYFEQNESVARQVYEGLRLMYAAKQGKVGRVRARGMGDEGLPADVLSILNDLASELDKKADPGSNN
ncbi:helix-turn-helix transcriptional regulator [Streptomyces tsukubensis]|uniref:DNA-binding protein n=1 Tax=Streptomyces tsukubensis TaxID=83656 RepID=A0A1V4A2M0_9ACTN|nr:helix-turn-helix transcriptional regulator [Streptomyces tsukubensis]OON73262.1 DNA-binding protein [Streptomyces tsukubensis]QFR94545.1 helix-turn-helix domain-containing protein [Streptomyces tsukubensis]